MGFAGADMKSAVWLLVYTVIFIAACLIPIIIMEKMLGVYPILYNKPNKKITPVLVCFGYMVIFAAGIVNGIVIQLLQKIGINLSSSNAQIPQNTLSVIVYFILTCVLPPVLEEVFIRGYIFNSLKPFGKTFAAVVSTLIFALLHSMLGNFIVYFAAGMILAILYIITDSLIPSIILHFVNNTLSFFFLYFQQNMNGISAISVIAYIYVVVIIAGIASTLYLAKKKIYLFGCLKKEEKVFKKMMSVYKSPAALAAFGLLVFLTAYKSFLSAL